MAGHSKWANIQHRKGRQDARRGKLFTKLIREITVAAKLGGDEPDSNPRLRAAVDNARANSMPKDTIDRAIRRGAGGEEGGALEEVRYEGYGPGGAAVMVDCKTDNRNRTVADVRHAFAKHGGNLGANGSVAYLFDKVGLLNFPPGSDEEALTEAALETEAEDVIANEDGSIEIVTAPDELLDIKVSLAAKGHEPESAEVTMRADSVAPLEAAAAETLLRLLDSLEDLDDVQRVYSNAEIPDEVLARLG